MDSLARTLVVVGVALVALGLLLYLHPSLPVLGRLPGDLRIERGNLRIYLPVTSCLVVSLVLSGVLWILSKLR